MRGINNSDGKDFTQIATDFRNISSRIYEFIFAEFRRSVKQLDRQLDENVFQQVQAKHIGKLKQMLEQETARTLESHGRHRAAQALQQEMTGQIAYLLSAFLLKARSM
jgi:hypothetical protein